MKKLVNRVVSVIFILSISLFNVLPTYAGTISNVIKNIDDGLGHQAFQMSVDSVASTSSVQAFCVGWTFEFTSIDKTMSTKVYVQLDNIDTDGGSRIYTMPISPDWSGNSDIIGGVSIYDKATYQWTLSQIMKSGCTVVANARIEKYSYSSSTGPIPLGMFANNPTELQNNFGEFSPAFLSNTTSDYFNWIGSLAPETIKLPNPSVILNLPTNGSTVVQGSTVTFSGTGTGVHHIGGYVDGTYIGVQNNPDTDITKQMTYSTPVKLDQIKDYTFQIKGRNTANEIDSGTKLAESAIHTVHVVAPPANSGNVYIKCLDYDTNTEISNTSQTLTGVNYGQPKSISAPTLNGYDVQGSYKTFLTAIPDKSKMGVGTSQTITLSTTNKNVYVYFWFKVNNVPPPPACTVNVTLFNQSVIVGEYTNISGLATDTKGHTITDYYWDVIGAEDRQYTANTARVLFNTKGIYDAQLIAQCSDGNMGIAYAKIYVNDPVPAADLKITGTTKENRKINIDGTTSYSPSTYPIDWSKTTWKIEPDLTTTAKWEMGVKLVNGSVKTINQSTDQSFMNGQSKLDFQVRYAGQYKVTLSIANTANFSNTVTKIITVIPDYSPVANFTMGSYIDRIQNNPVDATLQKWGKGNVYDNSYSPDGDVIKTRVWGYRYNSNNNLDTAGESIYADEITEYKYTSNLLPPIEKMIYTYNWNDWDSEGVPLNAQRVAGGYNNSQAIQTTANSTSIRCVLFFNTQSRSITGNTYTFSVYIKTQNLTGNVYINSYWTNQEGSWCWGNNIASAKLTGTNDWTRLIVTATAPANAYAQSLEVELTPGTGTVWISQPQIEDGSTASAYNANSVPDYFMEGHRLIVDGQNDTTVELWSYDVGDFAVELTVTEDIPDSETIKELLVDSDYKRGYKKEW